MCLHVILGQVSEPRICEKKNEICFCAGFIAAVRGSGGVLPRVP